MTNDGWLNLRGNTYTKSRDGVLCIVDIMYYESTDDAKSAYEGMTYDYKDCVGHWILVAQKNGDIPYAKASLKGK